MHRKAIINFDHDEIVFVNDQNEEGIVTKSSQIKKHTQFNKLKQLDLQAEAEYESYKIDAKLNYTTNLNVFYFTKGLYSLDNDFDNEKFKGIKPVRPQFIEYERKPERVDEEFNVPATLMQKLFLKKYHLHIDELEKAYKQATDYYKNKCLEIDTENLYMKLEYETSLSSWKEIVKINEKKRIAMNREINNSHKRLRIKGTSEMLEFYQFIKEIIEVPYGFEIKCNFSFNTERDLITLDITIPKVNDIPNEKVVKHIKTRGVLKTFYYNSTEMNKIYEKHIYSLIQSFYSVYGLNNYAGVNNICIKTNVDDEERGEILVSIISLDNLLSSRKDKFESDPKKWFDDNNGIVGAKFSRYKEINFEKVH